MLADPFAIQSFFGKNFVAAGLLQCIHLRAEVLTDIADTGVTDPMWRTCRDWGSDCYHGAES